MNPPPPLRNPVRAKLADVARLAKVSLATASRALNQPEIVGPAVRERVQNAVETLAYTPDRTAKALSSGKSHIIGAVVPTLGNAIFADGVEALQDRLSERGYTLLLSNSQYDQEKELRQIRALLEHGVDGLVLVGDSFASDALPLIRQHGIPFVTTYVCASQHDIPAIGIDNPHATEDMTRYLHKLGHREFAIIANTALPNDRSRARLEGMISALAGPEFISLDSIVEAQGLRSPTEGGPSQACVAPIRGLPRYFAPLTLWRSAHWPKLDALEYACPKTCPSSASTMSRSPQTSILP